MKTFLTTLKGKLIAGVSTLGAVGAIVAAVVIINSGYRTIVVDELSGTTVIKNSAGESNAYESQHLQTGDDATVSADSDLTLALDQDKMVYAEEHTHFWIEAKGRKSDGRTTIYMDEGATLNRIDRKLKDSEEYKVETPNATMSVRGTVFRATCSVDKDGIKYTLVEVFEGDVFTQVKMENGEYTGESQELRAGDSALIRSGDDFSEFVTDENKVVVQEIRYSRLSKKTAMVLGRAIDEGRNLSIGKDLLYDYAKINKHEFEDKGDGRRVCRVCEREEDEIKADEEADEEDDNGNKKDKKTEKDDDDQKSGDTNQDDELTDDNQDDSMEFDIEDGAVDHETPEGEDGIGGSNTSNSGDNAAPGQNAGDNSTKNNTPASSTPASSTPAGGENSSASNNPSQAQPSCANGHSYTTQTTQATCTKAGKTVKTCSVCGNVETSNIAAKGHTYTTKKVAATCTKAGSETKTCKRCGEKKVSTISKKGHDYEAVTTAATCTEAGKKVETCKNCKDQKETTIAATGHSYKTTTTEATCTEDGEEVQTCSNCGDKITKTITATGHDYETTSSSSATCTSGGRTVKTCKNCGDEDVTTTAALGHNLSQAGAVQGAAAGGQHYGTCLRCNESVTENCSYGSWQAADGYHHRECSKCGASTGGEQCTGTPGSPCSICGNIIPIG